MSKIPFCGQAYADKTLLANAQEAINVYPMKTKEAQYSDIRYSAAPDRIIMYPTPGYKWQTYLGIAPVRALFSINNILYIVSGSALIQCNPLGGTSLAQSVFMTVGTLTTQSGPVSIVCNNVQLVISDGQNGYTYVLSTGVFSTISGGGWPTTGGVTNFAYFDGYVIAAQNNSLNVLQSNVLDATTWGAQAFDTITSFADNITAVFSDELQLYIMGPKITEVQSDAGSIPYAFQKVPNVLIQAGCVAWQTIQKVANTIFFLASDIAGKAYIGALNGYDTKVLSTPPINEFLERLTLAQLQAANTWVYREGDNHFYCITVGGVTWCYDIKMDMFHKRSVNGGADLPTCCTLWNGQQIVGDQYGNLHVMSQNYSTYSTYDIATGVVTDTPLIRVRTAAHLNADGKTLFVKNLWVDMQVGDGFTQDTNLNVQPTASAPLVTLAVSKDYGRTWINVGTRTLGATGELQQRVIWSKLGRFRQNVTFRITITDPCQCYILGARADIKLGIK